MKRINQNTVSAGRHLPGFAPGSLFTIDGCMIFICEKGNASLTINFHSFDVTPGDVVFLFSDMVIEFGKRSEDFSIEYVNVTNEHTLEIYVNITSQRFWDKLYISPVRRFKEDERILMSHWMSECIFVYDSCRSEVSEKVISGKVRSLFQVMEDITDSGIEEIESIFGNTPWRIAGDFFMLLSRHYTSWHQVRQYADALNVTPEYLSVIMKECTGTSPKAIIEGQLILAVKSLLERSDLSVKNIASRLHYEDTSHLCKVFRRNTGMSPNEYRRQKRRQE